MGEAKEFVEAVTGMIVWGMVIYYIAGPCAIKLCGGSDSALRVVYNRREPPKFDEGKGVMPRVYGS